MCVIRRNFKLYMGDFLGELKAVKRKCCVLNCASKYGSFFRFPNPRRDPERHKISIRNLNNPAIQTMTVDKLYSRCFLCERHFLPEFIQFGSRRHNKTWNVIPTLFLSSQGKYSGEVTPPKQKKLEQTITSTDTCVSSCMSELQNQTFVKERYGPFFDQIQRSVNLMTCPISSPSHILYLVNSNVSDMVYINFRF